MMEQPSKSTIYKTLNIALLVVILILLVRNRERLAAMIHPKGKALVAQPAPELAAGLWLNSQPLQLSTLRGKVILLEFWAFQCRNCADVLPNLIRWHEEYKDDDLVLIAIHTPETEDEANLTILERYVVEHGITYPVLADNAYTTWNRYRVQFWPTTFLIDRKGNIRLYHNGELGFSGIESKIKELLDE